MNSMQYKCHFTSIDFQYSFAIHVMQKWRAHKNCKWKKIQFIWIENSTFSKKMRINFSWTLNVFFSVGTRELFMTNAFLRIFYFPWQRREILRNTLMWGWHAHIKYYTFYSLWKLTLNILNTTLNACHVFIRRLLRTSWT